ncbi:ATP-grasp domain-containing protein [Candidatus Peregrinibacteria bacterium]|nr:ATP-grasp domain-containing protein [Candidatus Peregrinibacteria bacterium]
MKSTENAVLQGKTILLVNTGNIKKRFVLQKLKKLGLQVIALNKEKNWAQPYVDQWILANTEDHQESLSAVGHFLKTNPHIKIEGVITFWEDDVILTSKISDKFRWIGIPYEITKNVRNKYKFRDFCRENNIASPQYRLLKNGEDLDFVRNEFSFPVVLKPAYGSSSAYVVKVEERDELENAFHYIRNNLSAQIESALHEGSDIIAEEYIEGDEVDIDILLQNGKVKFYSITDNFKTREPFFVEAGESIPSSLPIARQEELFALAEETLEKLNVQNGCIHFEAKSAKNGAVPIEVNLRMGGDEVYSVVKGVWGVDLIENAVKIALGLYIPKIRKPAQPKKYIIGQYFLSEHSGIVSKLDADGDLKRQKYIEELQIHKKIGDPILVPPEGFEYFGWVTVSGETMMDAQNNMNTVMKDVCFEVSRFHPASSIGKTVRKNHFSAASINKNILIRSAKIEKIRKLSLRNQRNLHIGIACNEYTEGEGGSVESELTTVGKNIEEALAERGYKVTFFDFNKMPDVFEELRRSNVDFIFNVCERINNTSLLEPHAAAIFDILQIPYSGSSPFTLALCIDKIRVKKIFAYHGIPTPKWDYAYTMDDDLNDALKYPIIVKPANTDNSIGITNESVVTDKKGLLRQMEKIIIGLGSPALLEEFIEGDEYDVSILGNEEDLLVLPLSRSIFSAMPEGYWHIYPFDSKWTPDPVYKKIIVQKPPKGISKRLASLITEISIDTYNILGCHDYGRVEIRVDKNSNPHVLELNPNPSINIGDCLPTVAKLVNMDYGDFLEEIIRSAIERYKNRPPYYHLQTNII